ncbi:hypothetical protein WI76_14110 [Burkholderia ubonensis]|nr:hypothetical protein WI76_14110 [Burkholderia ubonensis]KVW70901.1 hypothetical protein WK99_07305 [Burkholderia ubonensis]
MRDAAASAAPSCPGTVRLVALDTLAERFDVEFVYDGHAVSPVVRQFLAALHATGRRVNATVPRRADHPCAAAPSGPRPIRPALRQLKNIATRCRR